MVNGLWNISIGLGGTSCCLISMVGFGASIDAIVVLLQSTA